MADWPLLVTSPAPVEARSFDDMRYLALPFSEPASTFSQPAASPLPLEAGKSGVAVGGMRLTKGYDEWVMAAMEREREREREREMEKEAAKERGKERDAELVALFPQYSAVATQTLEEEGDFVVEGGEVVSGVHEGISRSVKGGGKQVLTCGKGAIRKVEEISGGTPWPARGATSVEAGGRKFIDVNEGEKGMEVDRPCQMMPGREQQEEEDRGRLEAAILMTEIQKVVDGMERLICGYATGCGTSPRVCACPRNVAWLDSGSMVYACAHTSFTRTDVRVLHSDCSSSQRCRSGSAERGQCVEKEPSKSRSGEPAGCDTDGGGGGGH